MFPKRIVFIAILFIAFLLPQLVDAQCAMCRAVLISEEDGRAAEGINDGIVYLMAIPYILLGVLGYFIYRKRNKNLNLVK